MMTCTHSKIEYGTCPVCQFEPFERNHYFDGKFMVARDFIDESKYHSEKLRHHNVRLHGWGVVCGLKVKQHPNEACQDRFVCIEPGTAIDCCGHEILVQQEECIDITQLEKWKELKKRHDASRDNEATYQLQVCLKYRECPTEDVPVLYDECGCDETKCAPNRILESYDVDLLINEEQVDLHEFHDPKLEWHCSAGPSHALRVAVYSAGNRLYAIANDKKAVLILDTTNHTVVGVYPLSELPTDLAISNDGKRLYVATKGGTAGDLQLIVWNTETDDQVSAGAIHGSNGDTVELAVVPMPDNRLSALLDKKGDVLIWPLTLDSASTQPSPSSPTPNLASNIHGLTFNKNAQMAYSARPSDNTIRVLKIIPTATAGAPINIPSPPYTPFDLEFVVSTGPDALAVISNTPSTLLYITLSGNQFKKSDSLAHPAKAVVIGPAGRWAYVLEEANGESYVQAVNLARVQLQLTPNVSPPFRVGKGSQQLVLDASGSRLYVPFEGDPKVESSGGIAVLKVLEGSCEDILWRHLDGCPDCDVPNCVVLATIMEYRPGAKIQDVNIDNRRGRRVLASTEILQEWIECLSEHPGVGKDGEDGRDGDPGPGLESGLTRIDSLSWKHGHPSPQLMVPIKMGPHQTRFGIVIGFSAEVETRTIDAEHVFEVLLHHSKPEEEKIGFVCWCAIRGEIVPVTPTASGVVITKAEKVQSGTVSRAVAFVPAESILNWLRRSERSSPNLWVRLRGDFVLDTQNPPRAIDGEFVRRDLPTGNRPYDPVAGSYLDLGIQGGLFESWFTLKMPESPR
jgi:DNA-binding beta-propeller fold protein YncE